MIPTNWIVFTGAACSGKTTILNCFRDGGFNVKGEVVREYLAYLYGNHIPVNKIPWSSASFQSQLLALKMKREQLLNTNELCFFDRGTFDVYAYSALQGIPMRDIYIEQPYRYKAVFLFEALPLVHDDLRRESQEDIKRQEESVVETYQFFGYSLIWVPRFSSNIEESISKRFEFIHSQLENLPIE